MSLDLVPTGDISLSAIKTRLPKESSIQVLPGEDSNHVILFDGESYLHARKAGRSVALARYGLNDDTRITNELERIFGYAIVAWEDIQKP